jgi:hypothetical protein
MGLTCGPRLTCMRLLLGGALLTLLVGATAPPGVSAQQRVPREYQLKAAFLMKFLGFVAWDEPQLLSDRSTICVLGENPFGGSLYTLARLHRSGEGAVEIEQLGSPDEGKHCHIVYISRSEADRLDDVFALLGDAPTVTVSDIEDFVERGGTIQLVVEDRRVGFIIHQERARARGIRFSAQLLALAKQVV